MELFLTIETQVGAEYLSDILRDVKEKLIFVTDTNIRSFHKYCECYELSSKA